MPYGPVPENVSENVVRWFPDDAERWLASVPGTLERLLSAWTLRPAGRPLEGGSHSYVLPVERDDGELAVLKIACRDVENVAEPTGLRAYDGDGAVRLFEYDPETGSMLLERAVPGAPLLEHDFPGLDEHDAARRRVAIACDRYRRLWRPPAPLDGLPAYPTGQSVIAGWTAAYADPSPRKREGLGPRWIARALELCDALRDPAEIGVANHDTHLGNIVSAEREPWLLIDPKPYLAERAFDAGYFVFKQVFHGPLGAPELLRSTADGLGADVERVRAWAVLRGLEQSDDAFGTPDGTESLRAAAAIDAA